MEGVSVDQVHVVDYLIECHSLQQCVVCEQASGV